MEAIGHVDEGSGLQKEENDFTHHDFPSAEQDRSKDTQSIQKTNTANQNSKSEFWNSNSPNQEAAEESWETPSFNQNKDLDMWNSNSTNKVTVKESWDTMEADEDFWSSETLLDNRKNGESEQLDCKENIHRTCESVNDETCENTDDNQTKSNVGTKEVIGKRKKDLAFSKDDNVNCDTNSNAKKIKTVENNTDKLVSPGSGSLDKDLDLKLLDTYTPVVNDINCDGDTERCKAGNEKMCKSNVERIKSAPSEETNDAINDDKAEKVESVKDKNKVEDTIPFHPYCDTESEKLSFSSEYVKHKVTDLVNKSDMVDKLEEEKMSENTDNDDSDNEDYLVIEDSDIDDGLLFVEKREKYRWRTVQKKDPYRLNEPLVLALEEVCCC